MNKKIFLTMLAAAAVFITASAQPAGKELNKEITLDKDFVPVLPVEKSSIKKKDHAGALPKKVSSKEMKQFLAPEQTQIGFNNEAIAVGVTPSIPTMEPYGYRTKHNWDTKRGYLDVGGGTQANFTGSAGYRIINNDSTTLGAWVQHNSSWAGRNSTPLITDDNFRTKQLYNDSRLGVYFKNQFKPGLLKVDAGVHFDSFNYYGGLDHTADPSSTAFDPNKKQSFLEFNLGALWNGNMEIAGSDVMYRAYAMFNHAGYDMGPTMLNTDTSKGAKENLVHFGIGGERMFDFGGLVLDIKGDYVNFHEGIKNGICAGMPSKDYIYFTLSPRYKWENSMFRILAGADILMGDINYVPDNNFGSKGKFRIAPAVNIDLDIFDGAAIYVDVKGGNTINSLSRMASLDRYSTPYGLLSNTWQQLNSEAGFKIGPFEGASAKVFAGYEMNKGLIMPETTFGYACNNAFTGKMRGFKVGFEAFYLYRSLLEASLSMTYAPGNATENFSKTLPDGSENKKYKNINTDWIQGCMLGIDGAHLVGDFNLKVTPMRQLAIEAGVTYRGQRQYYDYNTVKEMKDVINLHAGATWRFDKMLSLWLKGANLLNRRYDNMPGQGAQRLTVMAGASLTF